MLESLDYWTLSSMPKSNCVKMAPQQIYRLPAHLYREGKQQRLLLKLDLHPLQSRHNQSFAQKQDLYPQKKRFYGNSQVLQQIGRRVFHTFNKADKLA